jgi:hypothetical protein
MPSVATSATTLRTALLAFFIAFPPPARPARLSAWTTMSVRRLTDDCVHARSRTQGVAASRALESVMRRTRSWRARGDLPSNNSVVVTIPNWAPQFGHGDTID